VTFCSLWRQPPRQCIAAACGFRQRAAFRAKVPSTSCHPSRISLMFSALSHCAFILGPSGLHHRRRSIHRQLRPEVTMARGTSPCRAFCHADTCLVPAGTHMRGGSGTTARSRQELSWGNLRHPRHLFLPNHPCTLDNGWARMACNTCSQHSMQRGLIPSMCCVSSGSWKH
jgi:hypothetical protein